MKVWQITIATEEGGDNVDFLTGLAETAQEAIEKAMKCAEGYKDPYPSRVTEVGEQVF